MNVYGIGIDIVEIVRIRDLIARQGDRFLDRVFTAEERTYCDRIREPERCYAARFAAKEAIVKALGVGIGADANWLDLVIQREESGKPIVRLEGDAARFAESAGISEVLVSLSHSEHYAVAQALALRR